MHHLFEQIFLHFPLIRPIICCNCIGHLPLLVFLSDVVGRSRSPFNANVLLETHSLIFFNKFRSFNPDFYTDVELRPYVPLSFYRVHSHSLSTSFDTFPTTSMNLCNNYGNYDFCTVSCTFKTFIYNSNIKRSFL